MFERMQRSRNNKKKKQQQQQQQLQTRCSKAFCATCRLNDLSSPEEGESSNEEDEVKTVSSIAHAMVQVRLDQMIRERKEGRSGRRRRAYEDGDEDEETKLVVVVAMEKSSYDPREDFRESMEEIIVANRIQETKDLRRLLNYYMSMNSEEFRGTILEVFHQVCSDLFLKYF